MKIIGTGWRKLVRKWQILKYFFINEKNLYCERKKIMSPIESKRRKKNSENEMSDYECVECGKKYKDN